MHLHLALASLAVLLAGCESSFNVDFVATPLTDEDSAVTLRLEGVELRKTSGGTSRLTRNATGEYVVENGVDPVPADLLSNSDIDGDEYAGLRLLLADDPGTVSRTGLPDEAIEAGTGTGAEALVAFEVDDDSDDTVSLVIALDLVLSLAENEDEPGFTLDPVIRAMERADAASVGGTIPGTRFADPACSLGTALVYAFSGRDIVPDERDGVGVEPLATAPILRNAPDATGTYMLDVLAPGDYTLAFTCEGQFENGRLPAEDEDVDFFDGAEVSLDPGDSLRVDFDS